MTQRRFVVALLSCTVVCWTASVRPDDWTDKLEPFYEPPPEFAATLGEFRSPLKRADGSVITSAADWPLRRRDILETWQRRLGEWPPLVERPAFTYIETTAQDGFKKHHVHVQITNDGKQADGFLMVPNGPGPFPAVLVPFY